MLNFSIPQLAVVIPAILFSLSVHEFAHGMSAHLLGDPTPKNQGRLTLNPLAHLDPIGTLVLLLTQRFGWAKPVIINPFNYRGDRFKFLLLTALAGPASNLVIALLSAIMYNLFYTAVFFSALFWVLISLNVYLALFNLIPVPPLDGAKILLGLLPPDKREIYYRIEPYGPIILLVLIFTDVTRIVLPVIAGNLISVFLLIGRAITGG